MSVNEPLECQPSRPNAVESLEVTMAQLWGGEMRGLQEVEWRDREVDAWLLLN